jgi:hypothetical protein
MKSEVADAPGCGFARVLSWPAFSRAVGGFQHGVRVIGKSIRP